MRLAERPDGRYGFQVKGVAALAAIAAVAAILAVPSPALACKKDGPCESPVDVVTCPDGPIGSTDSRSASFNIPKDATNVIFTIKDAETGQTYDQFNPICGGTTLASSSQRIPGSGEDTFKVDYVQTSTGTSDPGESHRVKVTATWNRKSDLDVEKRLVGGGDTADAGETIVYSVRITNRGPASSNRIGLTDELDVPPGMTIDVVGIEQVAGPKPSKLRTGEDGADGIWDALDVDEEIVVLIRVVARGSGSLVNEARVDNMIGSGRIDTEQADNSDRIETHVRPAPGSQIERASAGSVSGSATPPLDDPLRVHRATPKLKRVDVAVLRKGGGKPFEGSGRSGGDCRWLASASGGFKSRKPREGRCDAPIWIEAKGTDRWRLKLRKDLPRGAYYVYSRATATDGSTEWSFTSAAGNREQLRVR